VYAFISGMFLGFRFSKITPAWVISLRGRCDSELSGEIRSMEIWREGQRVKVEWGGMVDSEKERGQMSKLAGAGGE
jgi:hypothetical protein